MAIMRWLVLFIFLSFSTTAAVLCAEGKVFEITRTNYELKVDGFLKEEAWNSANWIDDFLQNEPDRFNQPSERTVVKMLYDDEAIYIAFRCYDSEPGSIKGSLRRRDEDPPSDKVGIGIDSRNDNQTAFAFLINASGLMRDLYIFDDGNDEDDSWDAVWEGNVSIDDEGWTTEMKIPFSTLRYAPSDKHTWGVYFIRYIHRTNEEITWTVYPRDKAGFVSLFGELKGIEDIPQPFNLEVLPYTFGKYCNTEDEKGSSFGIGADIKYSLSSGVILDAAINPDFGQVEADPSVLNLSVFETYYPEKRPFFLEGAALFETPYTVFYTRRIGKQPSYYDCLDDEEIVSQPDYTTILGAAKVTGKTADGLSFGIIEAVTDREYATVENEDGERREMLLEPYTNYFVSRFVKDIWEGNSSVGVINTAMNRESGMSAYTGGIDWNLYFNDNDYNTNGQIVFSNRGDTPDERDNGYALEVEFEKAGGKHHGFDFEFAAVSPDFNIWDMGYLSRNNEISAYAEYLFRTREPVGIFRRTISGLETWQGWNYDGTHISNGVGLWTNLRYLNYWDTDFGVSYNFERYSDLETRGGPLLKPPANYGFWFWGGSDWRNNIRPEINFWGGKNASRSWWWGVWVGLTCRPIERMKVEIYFMHDRTFDENQWVDNIDDDSDSTHYVFGRLDRRTWELTLRLSYNFSRNMSLQIYTQPYNSIGDYLEYVELAEAGTYKFQPYDLEDNEDFNWKSMNFNAVFRWEYAPGSVIYAVWNRGMEDEEYPARFDAAANFSHLLNAPGNDIFMLKVNKWFDF